jgi:type II secretory pathway component PulF
MPTSSLDEFMALNDQLAALVEAGVPLDVDLGRPAQTAATLERINALVARRVSQGTSLAAAIESEDKLMTPSYRSLVQLGLRSENLAAGLAGSNRLATSALQARQATRLALVYPAIVCCLAFVGLIGFCLYFVPVLESTYGSLRIPAGSGLQTLRVLRGTLPYWASAVPLAALLIVGWRAQSPSRSWPILPARARAILEERAASFADALATLLDAGTPLPEALRLAADGWNDAAQGEATRLLATALDQGQPISESSPFVARFPPFLRWALLSAASTMPIASALRTAAKTYRRSAARRQRRLQVVIPMVAGLAIGGTAALLYGLALFIPVVEMLRGLAAPTF